MKKFFRDIGLRHKYPELNGRGCTRPNEDYELSNEDNGDAEIIFEWHTEKYPKPSDSDMEGWYEEWEALEYARNRKEEYDALNQFELISDDDANGTTTHKDAIATVKTKWPKDNSGPVE